MELLDAGAFVALVWREVAGYRARDTVLCSALEDALLLGGLPEEGPRAGPIEDEVRPDLQDCVNVETGIHDPLKGLVRRA